MPRSAIWLSRAKFGPVESGCFRLFPCLTGAPLAHEVVVKPPMLRARCAFDSGEDAGASRFGGLTIEADPSSANEEISEI